MNQPSYINVIREPTQWFQSHYYFERFGWMNDPGERDSFEGSEADRLRSIDDCVQNGYYDCVVPKCQVSKTTGRKKLLTHRIVNF